MSEVPGPEVVDRFRAVNSRLRELLAATQAELVAVRAAKDAELVALRLEKDAENAELRKALQSMTLRVAELERQRGSGSDDSGVPSSKEPIAAKGRRKAERKARRERDADTSSRQRSKDKGRVGSRGTLRIEPSRLVNQCHKYVLRDFLRDLLAPAHMQREPVDARLSSAVERGEGFFIALV